MGASQIQGLRGTEQRWRKKRGELGNKEEGSQGTGSGAREWLSQGDVSSEVMSKPVSRGWFQVSLGLLPGTSSDVPGCPGHEVGWV